MFARLTPRRLCSAAPLAAGLLALAPAAVADGLNTQVVSLSSAGMQGDQGSGRPVVSADGTKIAFLSFSTDLVPGDTNGKSDLFVRDLTSGITTLVSRGVGGVLGNGDTIDVTLSADGNTVAWSTSSSNLVPGDTNNAADIFVRDLPGGVVERVSVRSNGAQANFHSEEPWLSSDGRVVTFGSQATNLVAGDTNGSADIFVHVRSSGQTILVSQSTAGALGMGNSAESSMNGDGTLVVFSSDAPNLVPGDTNLQSDIFLRDLNNGTTTRLSVGAGGVQGTSGSRFPRITSDGRWVAFETGTGAFNPLDTNGKDDVYVVDMNSGTLERVSTNAAGVGSSGHGTQPTISSNGRFVAFSVRLGDLDAADTNNKWDIYRKDRLTGDLQRVSLGPGGQQDDVGSGGASISADGSRIAFNTNATTFLAPDLNGFEADVYLASCPPPGAPYCSALPNSVGSGAQLIATGSNSISDDSLALFASGLPNSVCLFFRGPQQTDAPFGNGRLCVTGQIARLGPPLAVSNGSAQRAVNPVLEGLTPGVQNFQAWYRDIAGGGSMFNTSDGYSVLLVP